MRPLLAALHETAAVHLVQPAYRGYRHLRPGYRRAAAAARAGLRFRRAAAGWPPERRRAWMLERLRGAVRHAYARTPYYRRLLDAAGWDPRADFGFDDFARLPVLERGAVREHGREMLARDVPAAQLREDATGGSGGEPTRVWRGPGDRGWSESGPEYFMRRLGLPPGISTGLLWGHHLDPVASDRWADRLRDWMEDQRWFECLRLSPEALAAHHARLQAWRPACVVAYAGALDALAEHVGRCGPPPRYPGRAFVTGAEKLLPHHRERVEAVFGRPVHERYGSRDVGLVGFQTDPARTLDFEVDWANLLVEPETSGGTASLLVTRLHADGMPMLRYRIGDRARFADDARPGWPAFVLHEVVGRETDRLWLPAGGWVDGLMLPHLMKDHPVRTFQVAQAADYSVTVRVVPLAGFTETTRERIRRAVADSLRGVPVAVQAVDEIAPTRSGKGRPVVSDAAPAGSAP
jgi:phenylacetate-CoA ligase